MNPVLLPALSCLCKDSPTQSRYVTIWLNITTYLFWLMAICIITKMSGFSLWASMLCGESTSPVSLSVILVILQPVSAAVCNSAPSSGARDPAHCICNLHVRQHTLFPAFILWPAPFVTCFLFLTHSLVIVPQSSGPCSLSKRKALHFPLCSYSNTSW